MGVPGPDSRDADHNHNGATHPRSPSPCHCRVALGSVNNRVRYFDRAVRVLLRGCSTKYLDYRLGTLALLCFEPRRHGDRGPMGQEDAFIGRDSEPPPATDHRVRGHHGISVTSAHPFTVAPPSAYAANRVARVCDIAPHGVPPSDQKQDEQFRTHRSRYDDELVQVLLVHVVGTDVRHSQLSRSVRPRNS